MKHTGIPLGKGFKLGKDGRRLSRTDAHKDVSARIRDRAKKRVRVGKAAKASAIAAPKTRAASHVGASRGKRLTK